MLNQRKTPQRWRAPEVKPTTTTLGVLSGPVDKRHWGIYEPGKPRLSDEQSWYSFGIWQTIGHGMVPPKFTKEIMDAQLAEISQSDCYMPQAYPSILHPWRL